MTSIWWIRRDLRLHDNLALTAASARSGSEVVPLYIFDPNIAGASAHRDANHRRDFLFDGLEHLDRDLHGRGSGLVFRTGPAADVLAAVAAEVNASTILAERDHTPSARARDAAIAKILPLELLGSPAARAPGDVLKPDGEPYRMFAPYRRAWRALPPLRSSELLSVPQFLPTRARIGSEQIPPHAPSPLQAGVVEARARLDGFTRGAQPAVLGYGEGRDRLDSTRTAGISPYLHFGMLSAREAVVRAEEAGRGIPVAGQASVMRWIDELIWRDFYLSRMEAEPSAEEQRFDIEWRNAPEEIAAWCEGRTGVPIVDASMRQLALTGWMHNRARMITASFLVKQLLVNWRIGEAWFMKQLIDGDLASNRGNWRWVAGVGVEASPFFRIFNPVAQGQRFDPDGHFVRRWLPSLSSVPVRLIHEPWRMTDDQQRDARVRIGLDYPAPIVDLRDARERALRAYAEARRAK